MIRKSLYLLLSLLMASSLFADEKKPKEDLPWLLSQLAEGTKPRKAAMAKILSLSNKNLGEVVKAAKIANKSDDPELRSRAGSLLKKLYRRHELGEGAPYHGMKLGWFIQHSGKKEGKSVSSAVLVLEVDKESPAEKAGINSGDVIYQIGKSPLRGMNTRNDFVKHVNSLKPGTEIELRIRYNSSTKPFDIYQKNKKKKTKLVLGEANSAKSGGLDPNLFKLWVDSFAK